MNKREQQRIERRQQILLCSLDMIISRGYQAMKIRDIARKLNISTGLFFNHFESKEDIYRELVEFGLTGPEGVLKLNVEGVQPVQFFELTTATIFKSLKESTMTAKMFVLISQAMRSEDVPESVKQVIGRMDVITPVIPVIRRGQQAGEIREGDPAALAAAFWGAVQGIATNYAIYPEWPLPEVSWIVDILRA